MENYCQQICNNQNYGDIMVEYSPKICEKLSLTEKFGQIHNFYMRRIFFCRNNKILIIM